VDRLRLVGVLEVTVDLLVLGELLEGRLEVIGVIVIGLRVRLVFGVHLF
jgi:hypothetical protein